MDEVLDVNPSSKSPGIWHLITGVYPPELGGVADYTEALAKALTTKAAETHIWTTGHDADWVSTILPSGATLHRIPRAFGPPGLFCLGRELNRFQSPRRLLIQYVPHAYGFKAMNLPFVLWLLSRRMFSRDEVLIMFHEVAFPWVSRPLRLNVIAAANRLMAAIVLWASTRVYVSIPAWIPLLRRLGAGGMPIECLPIPSSIPDSASAEAVTQRRAVLTQGDPAVRLLCHFGTYGPSVTNLLRPVLARILTLRPNTGVVLLGAGGEHWRDELIAQKADWLARVTAPGSLDASLISEYLQACDLIVQPYPDGASCRRTTLMAALANGKAVITTIGHLSEPFWSDGAVAVVPAGDIEGMVRLSLELLDQSERLAELGSAGLRLYQSRFDIRYTVAALLDLPCSLSTVA